MTLTKESPSPRSTPSSIWGEFLQRRMLNGRQWYETFGSPGRVGVDDLGTEKGGSGCPYIGADILDGGTIGPAIWVRDMGPDPEYWY